MTEDQVNPGSERGQSTPRAPAHGPAAAPEGTGTASALEREVAQRIAERALEEQRRARRWGIFFKFVLLAYVTGLLLLQVDWGDLLELEDEGHAAVVEVEGIIGTGGETRATQVLQSLRDALEADGTRGVLLKLNSPGGSPVQSGRIYQGIRALRDRHPDKPIYAVTGDVCASGCYYVAAAAERIFVDRASIVGSIGVLMNGFGFVDAMRKLGVERRLLTAGEHKALFDPFSPLKPDEVEHLQGMLSEIHAQFIEAVRSGRGERLARDERLFSGLVWTGEKAVELGLADGFGSAREVAEQEMHTTRLVDFTRRESYLERLSRRFGAAIGAGLARALGPDVRTLLPGLEAGSSAPVGGLTPRPTLR